MNALGVLFNRYAHLVAAIALGILKDETEANDVTQEIFEVVAKDLKNHNVKNFNAWIYSVTKFHCFKVKKKVAVVGDLDLQQVPDLEDADDLLEQELLLQRRIKLLKQAIGEIKPDQKKCVELFYLKGYSYMEVAQETGFTLKEVKSYIQNGKRNLKLIINNNDERAES